MSLELAEPTLALSDSGLTRLRSSHVSLTSALSLRRSSHVGGARLSASADRVVSPRGVPVGARSLVGRRAPALVLCGRDGEPPTTHASSSACISRCPRVPPLAPRCPRSRNGVPKHQQRFFKFTSWYKTAKRFRPLSFVPIFCTTKKGFFYDAR
jgi:hypothetical protein